MKNEIIHNVDNVNVSSNELVITAVLNRNFRKLYENDMELMKYTLAGTRNLYRIMPYVPGKAYQKNELVWFIDYYLSPRNERLFNEEYSELSTFAAFHGEDIDETTVSNLKEKYYTVSLYLLRSLRGNNTSMPKREIVNFVPLFDASGWKNENPFGTIYTDFFEDFTAYNLSVQLENMHNTLKKYHKFGTLSSFTNIDDKVLKADFSNISPDRSNVLFPGEISEIEPDATILGGTQRIWDTGYLEYDIEFQLGNDGSSYQIYNEDGSLKTVQSLDANYFSLRQRNTFTSDLDAYDNRKYYYQDSDADIFIADNVETVDDNGISQSNLNSKVNVFVGTIRFPIPFADTNYCIFTEMSNCIATNGSDIAEGNVNGLVYANKSRQSVTAILIIPTYNGNNPKVLYDNRFRCQICGRGEKQRQ